VARQTVRVKCPAAAQRFHGRRPTEQRISHFVCPLTTAHPVAELNESDSSRILLGRRHDLDVPHRKRNPLRRDYITFSEYYTVVARVVCARVYACGRRPRRAHTAEMSFRPSVADPTTAATMYRHQTFCVPPATDAGHGDEPPRGGPQVRLPPSVGWPSNPVRILV